MHRFPYRVEGNPGIARPTVDVKLECGTGEWTTRALIDTGSPLTVFDYGTAEALGVRIGNTGHRAGMVALLGADRPVQFEYVDLTLLNAGGHSWVADVAFIKQMDFQMPFQGILGQQGFLDRHVVTFHYYAGYLDVINIAEH